MLYTRVALNLSNANDITISLVSNWAKQGEA